MPKLMLERCCRDVVSYQKVRAVKPPEPTSTWHPVAHEFVIGALRAALVASGFRIPNSCHTLIDGGERYFGLVQLEYPRDDPRRPQPRSRGRGRRRLPIHHAPVLGIRNGHNKRYPAGLFLGFGLHATDQIIFTTEIRVGRKNTPNVLRDLPVRMMYAAQQLHDLVAEQEHRIAEYRDHQITHEQCHDLIIRALDSRVVGPTKIPYILEGWRASPRPELLKEGKSLWRLVHAFANVLEEYQIFSLPALSTKLTAILDNAAGFHSSGTSVDLDGGAAA